MHLEPKHAGHVPCRGFLRNEERVDLEKDVLEGGAEVGAVDGGVSGGFRVVEVLALGAVEFDELGVGGIGHAGGEEMVCFAVDAGAFAEVAFLVFLELLMSTVSQLDISCEQRFSYHL